MDIIKMLETQKNLDDKIIKKHNIDDAYSIDYLNNLKVSLIVELSELANELQFFKIWKIDKKINNDRVLDELADCLHFSLSILNYVVENSEDLKINLDSCKNWTELGVSNKRLNLLFLNITSCLQKIYLKNPDSLWAIDVFSGILDLGFLTGFTQEQIEQAYFEKNKINHKRQDENY